MRHKSETCLTRMQHWVYDLGLRTLSCTLLQSAGNMDEKAPSVLDVLDEERRAKFDNNLARVLERALEKHADQR